MPAGCCCKEDRVSLSKGAYICEWETSTASQTESLHFWFPVAQFYVFWLFCFVFFFTQKVSLFCEWMVYATFSMTCWPAIHFWPRNKKASRVETIGTVWNFQWIGREHHAFDGKTRKRRDFLAGQVKWVSGRVHYLCTCDRQRKSLLPRRPVD